MSPHLLSSAGRLAGASLLRVQSDERLVALIRSGHDPAFAAVVDRYRPDLLRFAARLVGPDRAEDVVQQAFVNAHGALSSSAYDVTLRPWLYRIVHNAALSTLRAGRRESELDEHMAAPTCIEDEHDVRERLHEALAAIAALPAPQRDALTLQALEQRSATEIAAALGVSPGAARQHLHRARSTVRAAATAVTPYGLLARLLPADAGGAVVTGGLAGAGATATLVKVGAGVLAAGALVGAGTSHTARPPHHARAAAGGTAAALVVTHRSATPAGARELAAGTAPVAIRTVARHDGAGDRTPAGDEPHRRRHGRSSASGSGSREPGPSPESGRDGSPGSPMVSEVHHSGSSGSSGSGDGSSGSSGSGGSSGDGSSHDMTPLAATTGTGTESLVTTSGGETSGSGGSGDGGTSGGSGTSGGGDTSGGGSTSGGSGASGGGSSDDGLSSSGPG